MTGPQFPIPDSNTGLSKSEETPNLGKLNPDLQIIDPVSGQFAPMGDVLDMLLNASRRSGDKRTLHIMPFAQDVLQADGFPAPFPEKVQIYPVEQDAERILLYYTFTGHSGLTTAEDFLVLQSIQPVIRHNDVDLIEPENGLTAAGAPILVPLTFDALATVKSTAGTGGAVTSSNQIAGTLPLFKRIGPGGRIFLGTKKTVGPGFGPTWHLQGVVHYVKI